MASSKRNESMVERVGQELERVTGEEHAREELDNVARELQREHADAEERRRRKAGAKEAERNPRRGVGSR